MDSPTTDIPKLLGDEAESLRSNPDRQGPPPPARSTRAVSTCPAPTSSIACGSRATGRSKPLRNLQAIYGHGRLGGTGYLSILPVDQGVEHSAGASFAKNPDYFDPENIVRLAVEGGCNAVASTFGVLGIGRAQVRAQDPLHREDQPQPAPHLPERLRPDALRHRRGGLEPRRGRGRRDDLLRERGSPTGRSSRSPAPSRGRTSSGMATVLWCYLRNDAFKKRQGLPPLRRPYRTGRPPRRDDPSRPREAEGAREQRRLQGPEHGRQPPTASSTSGSTPN